MIISTTNKMVIKPTMIKLVIFTLSILSLVKFPTPNDFGNDRRYSFLLFSKNNFVVCVFEFDQKTDKGPIHLPLTDRPSVKCV